MGICFKVVAGWSWLIPGDFVRTSNVTDCAACVTDFLILRLYLLPTDDLRRGRLLHGQHLGYCRGADRGGGR